MAFNAPAARRGVGSPRRPSRRGGHRRAGGRRHPAVVPPGQDPGPPGAGRVRERRWAPIPEACSRGTPRSSPTARTSSSGRRPARPAGATTSTPGSTTGCSSRPTSSEYLDRLGQARIAGLRRPGRARFLAVTTRRPTRPTCAAPVGRLGARRGVRGPLPGRPACHGRAADAVLAGAGVANLAAWLAVELARRRGVDRSCSPPSSACGATSRRPADPFVFNHRSFPTRHHAGRQRHRSSAPWPAGPGTTLLGCLGAAQIDRHGNINSTVIPGRTFLVGSGGGNDVASQADEVVVMVDPHSAPDGRPRCPTSPRPETGCGRWSPTSASSRRTSTANWP